MTTLIINADDFGYCEAVNYGIISAHQAGLVNSTTMMANMPGVEHAVSLLQANPRLGCGIHLTLSCYKPVLKTHQTIVDESGYFHKRITPEVAATFDLDEVYAEFSAQIEKAKALGVNISHFDSHHHIHTMKEFAPVISKLVETYKLPIRGGLEYELPLAKQVPLMDQFYGDNVDVDFFEKYIEQIKSHEVVDLMAHPAFLDDFILNSTSYATKRTVEHKILTSETVKYYLKNQDVNIGNYHGISKGE